jgi:hypothetical protein
MEKKRKMAEAIKKAEVLNIGNKKYSKGPEKKGDCGCGGKQKMSTGTAKGKKSGCGCGGGNIMEPGGKLQPIANTTTGHMQQKAGSMSAKGAGMQKALERAAKLKTAM